jgi:hypothetical protein
MYPFLCVFDVKNQNGGSIQDGDENVFIFHIIKRHFDYPAWQH